MAHLTEYIIEQAAIAWLESPGWMVKHGAAIAPGKLAAERDDFSQVVLMQRLRDALVRINPTLAAEILNDAFRKVPRAEGRTLEAQVT
jgi:type I restriction enzyme, R subunit